MPTPVTVTITDTTSDETLPLQVENGFDPSDCIGKQLDVIGKYVGVSRSAFGITKFITLNDDDFRSLIQIAILKNSLDSSLSVIQDILNTYFNGVIRIYDHSDMRISYLIDSNGAGQDLVQMFVGQGLLPKPMGVGQVVVYFSGVNNFFGFSTYDYPPVNNHGFNDYDHADSGPWLSYDNSF